MRKKEKILCFLISHGTLSYQKNYYSKIYNNTIAEEVAEKRAINCAQSGLALSYLQNHVSKKKFIKNRKFNFFPMDILKIKIIIYML